MLSKERQQIALDREMVSPPGDTLLETIQAFSMSQVELSERMGRPLKTVNELIAGRETITSTTALQLERVLGVPSSFWLERQLIYERELLEINEREQLLNQKEWAKQFPIQEMMKKGWLPFTDKLSGQIKNLLLFLGIDGPEEWQKVYIGNEIQTSYYRISLNKVAQHAPLSAWLRRGELQARSLSLATYDKAKFKQQLEEVRKIAELQPQDFFSQLQKACAIAGVAVVYTPCLAKTHVNGVARWIRNGQTPLIQLSGRYKSNDKFWFTFFHEAGHLLKHGKKDFFIDGLEGLSIDVEKEEEANQFAANCLIPAKAYQTWVSMGSYAHEGEIAYFAQQVGSHPAIVAGRLANDKYLTFREAQPFSVSIEIDDAE